MKFTAKPTKRQTMSLKVSNFAKFVNDRKLSSFNVCSGQRQNHCYMVLLANIQ
jgi:hypothetical protein